MVDANYKLQWLIRLSVAQYEGNQSLCMIWWKRGPTTVQDCPRTLVATKLAYCCFKLRSEIIGEDMGRQIVTDTRHYPVCLV